MKIIRYLTALLLIILSTLPVFSAQLDDKATNALSLALEMFKADEYLPAVDLLKEAEKNLGGNFNYWLYLGLGYQRTGQTEQAIDAYERAGAINPDAGNLPSRIRALKLETKRLKYVAVKLNTDKEKSAYLMAKARQFRKKYLLDQAFRYFLQALMYDKELLKHDEGFITAGEVFYNLKKTEHAELFLGILQFFQGDRDNAEKNITVFLESSPPGAEFLQRRAQEYLQKIQLLKAQAQMASAAEAKASAIKIVTQKVNKPPHASANQDVEAIEAELELVANARFSEPDSGFVEFFATEVAKKQIAELNRTEEPDKKCRIIWELGNSNLQNPEVMAALNDNLLDEDIGVVSSTLEAIGKIGAPAAVAVIDSLLNLMDHEELTIKFMAIETLGKIKEQPQKVVPVLLRDYIAEKDIYLKRHVYYWVNKFGKPGVNVLYRELEEADRVDRAPIAELISRITGEKVQALIDR